MSEYYEVVAREPLIARDGRPFLAGSRMKSVDWVYPSVAAGSVRTMTGKAAGRFDVEALKRIQVAGPLPARGGELYVPAPLDCVVRTEPAAALAARPREKLAGRTNLPGGLWPAVLDGEGGGDFKPAAMPAFVGMGLMEKWLAGRGWEYPFQGGTVIERVEVEERTHVSIEAERGAARESMLYSTVGLSLPDGVTLEVRTEGAAGLGGVHPLGGERRMAHWRRRDETAELWACPVGIRQALGTARRVRMVLATAGAFADGWAPGWLLGGEAVPGTGVKLKLRGACVGRGRAVSGWSLEAGRMGPKAARRLAPAGSVYFCEVVEGAAAELAGRWLQPVSDGEQDRKDGFGLALWGLWNEEGA